MLREHLANLRLAPLTLRRHAELLVEHMGEERGCKEIRKHITWYLKGFPAGGELRHRLALVDQNLSRVTDVITEVGRQIGMEQLVDMLGLHQITQPA